ncbi:pyoverdine maturation tyrosinase PvdP [Pseudomonas agarici]|uniref:pyoverdine maturation tyrosinase PvdP n=1 Tax=Pseudomonas agarici TaxID=46677 RepID=UPI00031433A0|nr:hypothetical protein [Pseudomonas agarici]NWB93987.1 PvdJ/PvdD/PvdP-like protein [Pseudomonas agarici]NWC10480.1 PvdJ/PvdD/PvdP-like protein [Pseudomonas agarici]SEL39252.1 hypothetical protein SAMN05216604_11710 [Pseudomonas agarici]
MTISRRGFIAGLALTGAGVAAAYYAHRQWRRVDEPITPGEASVALPDLAGRQRADSLRGVWDLRLEGRDASLEGLPGASLGLLLDIAPRGRGLCGYLDTTQGLRGADVPRYQVLGDLLSDGPTEVRWRLLDGRAPRAAPLYEFVGVFDEVWAEFANAGVVSLSGRVLRLDRPLAAPEADCRFVAVKRRFPEARERIGLNPTLLAWLVSAEHRLFHQLWHASRDKWHTLSKDKQNALRGIGWQPGPRDRERDARGPRKDRNGSGVDFFFMHRHMLATARSMQDLPSWQRFPLPQPELLRDRQGFVRYFDNHDGYSIPPTWLADGDAEYTQWVSDIKNTETFHSNFLVWESQYRDPRYLSRLTLGQFGSEIELGLHDWLHMRWASVPRDPSNGAPVPMARDSADFAARWYEPENDFLGDPFSSHVNPVFWHFHGWIDDRIEDWFGAHERFHPGEVNRLQVNGIPWFAPGRWVEVDDPWLGPSTHGCSTTPGLMTGKSVEMDPETMKLALRITFGDEKKMADLFRRVPRRPWYARHQVAGNA